MSEDAFWDLLPREFSRLVVAYREREEARVNLLIDLILLPTNHLRYLLNKPMAMGQKPGKIKPLTREQVRGEDQEKAGPMSREEYEAMKAHFKYLREHGTRTLLN